MKLYCYVKLFFLCGEYFLTFSFLLLLIIHLKSKHMMCYKVNPSFNIITVYRSVIMSTVNSSIVHIAQLFTPHRAYSINKGDLTLCMDWICTTYYFNVMAFVRHNMLPPNKNQEFAWSQG